MYKGTSFTRDDLEKEPSLLVFNLQYFANDEGGEKTEEATPKKLEDARKDGQVAKSQELGTAVTLIALFGSLKVFIGFIAGRFQEMFPAYYNSIETYTKEPFNSNFAEAFVNKAMGNILIICLPMFAIAVVLAVVINVFQVKWQPTLKPLMPKFNKINPISGFIIVMRKNSSLI